jgi:hypothetical protein
MSVFLRGRSVKLRHRPQHKTRAHHLAYLASAGFRIDSSSDMNFLVSIEA